MAEKKEKEKDDALTVKQGEEALLAKQAADEEAMNKLLFYGDLSSLSISQQKEYCFQLAKVMGLNPWTKPFDMITDSKGRLFVYANKGCAAQLRHTRSIDLQTIYEGPLRMADKYNYGIYTVIVEASIPDRACPDGFRRVRNVGAIGIDQLIGEALSNAVMKCYTKAIRRATLDVCGIGFPDESELDSIPGVGQQEARPQRREPQPLPQIVPQTATIASGEKVNTSTGEIIDAVPNMPPAAPQPVPQPVAATVVPKSKFPPAVPPVGVKSAQ